MIVWLPVLLGLLCQSGWAAENRSLTGTIVDVQQKAYTKVLYYLVNTPVTRDEPYFEVSVRIRDRIYSGEYRPRHAAETLTRDLEAQRRGSASTGKAFHVSETS